MGARPGGHLGGAGRICALGVALWAVLALSSGPSGFPATLETTGVASLRELPRRPEGLSASARSLAPLDAPEDDPAAEAVCAGLAPSLPPAELPRDARTEEPLAPLSAAPSPRGPPAGFR